MAQKKLDPKSVAESTSKKVLNFLNTAGSAEEIASAIEIEGERDIGIKIAEVLLDRRARLGGFQNLDQVCATPLVGDVRFGQIVKALEARKEKSTTYVIEGEVKSAEKIDFASEKLAVHAIINGIEVASAEVDKTGRYQITFESRDKPQTTELRILPAKIPARASKSLALSKTVSSARYRGDEKRYRASMALQLSAGLVSSWHTAIDEYHMHGAVYATKFVGGSPISLEPLPAAKIAFYEVDRPFIWLLGTTPAITETYLGHAYTAPDGSYDFSFNFSYTTGRGLISLISDKVPDIRARISQFVDGSWTQVYEEPVEWDVVQDYHRDYFIPKENVIPVPPLHAKPDDGFRFVSLGLIPIDDTHINEGYATSQPGDPAPISGVSHQPFCDTLRIFGLFAEATSVATYKVQIAAAVDGVTYPEDDDPNWENVTDPLHNRKWNEVLNKWEFKVLGPDPATGRYKNVDTEPEADWHEHALKVTWNSRNVADGCYALRIVGYDAADAEVDTFEMLQIIRIDNTLPEINLEAIGNSDGVLTDCGVVNLKADRVIKFKITAYDPEKHVKRYSLTWTRGKHGHPASTAWPLGVEWIESPGSVPGWEGCEDQEEELIPDPSSCSEMSYNVELRVRGLSTNGYSAEPLSQWDKRESNLVVKEP